MVVGVFAAAAYFYLSNRLLDLVLPDSGDVVTASRNLRTRARSVPWLFLSRAPPAHDLSDLSCHRDADPVIL
jgi:alpha-glucoside transport system permease protein